MKDEVEKPCRRPSKPWYKDKDGYPLVYIDGKLFRLIRIVAEAEPGEVVRHLCSNKWCVEPTHLKIGTSKENTADCIRDGTHISQHQKGELHSQAKLLEKDILNIRKLRSEGWLLKDLADEYELSIQHVSDIILRKRWAHV